MEKVFFLAKVYLYHTLYNNFDLLLRTKLTYTKIMITLICQLFAEIITKSFLYTLMHISNYRLLKVLVTSTTLRFKRRTLSSLTRNIKENIWIFRITIFIHTLTNYIWCLLLICYGWQTYLRAHKLQSPLYTLFTK